MKSYIEGILRTLLHATVSFAAIMFLLSGKAWAQKAPALTETPSAEELLKASDKARGGALLGLTWNVAIDTVEDKEKVSLSYVVKVKNSDALAECSVPPKKKGETFVFNDRSLWYYKPGLKKPVSISSRQKLSGQAANGDIASTNYARDYEGKILGEEVLDGKPVYKLELKAKAKNVTYDGIRYWISKDQRLGIKAEFLTLQGKVFKIAVFEYGNTLEMDGKSFPFVSKMTITDAAFQENSTTMSYTKPVIQDHPASIFNVNNLIR